MNTYLLAVLTIVIFIHIFFIIAYLKEDNSVMTFAWPLGLLSVGLVLFLQMKEVYPPQQVVLFLLLIWSVRLFLHTFIRNLKRGYEDFRYAELRKSTDQGFLFRSYFQFFVIQGIFMFLIALPLITVFSRDQSELTLLSYVGIVIFVIGFLVESIADWQLDRFKAKNEHDAVLMDGLWSYSRHPNYLGESLVWWGLFLVIIPISGSWWTIISPLLLTLSLRYVSGVPMIEARYADNEEYQKYIREVNPLLPFI